MLNKMSSSGASKTKLKSGSLQTITPSLPVNACRAIVAQIGPRPLVYDAANVFIPAFGMMFYIIHALNAQVTSIPDFSDCGYVSDWCPLVSILYFSVLAIVQTLRAMKIVQTLSNDQAAFLANFTAIFPLEILIIPGPLVHVFRSISVSNPGFSSYGFSTYEDVSPILPPLMFKEEQFYNMLYHVPGTNPPEFLPQINMMLPHIPLLYDQFVHMVKHYSGCNAQQGNVFPTWVPFTSIFGSGPPTGPAQAIRSYNNLKASTGLWNRPEASDALLTRFSNFIVTNSAHEFPSPWVCSGGQENYATMLDYMMMSSKKSWFSVFIRSMHRFNSHWNGNLSLLQICPGGSSAGMIRFKEITCEETPTENPFGFKANSCSTARLEYNSSAHSACPYHLDEDFQDAQIAQLNIECDDFVGFNIGQINVTKFGDFWELNHDYCYTDRGNLLPNLRAIISGSSYFNPKGD